MYPAWFLPTVSSAFVIAAIAVFHILPSHFATGALWIGVYIERKAIKENRPELLEFIKKFALLILIFCFIYGSITGVGIWFASAAASPRAISALIHNYVWGWATEWVFFIIEVVTIYAYYYTLNKVDPIHHLRIGWIYAWGAWISMVIITGILAFMLTPDRWLETGKFFDGFFNSTYWPQLLTRTAFMFSIAATYALIVSTRMSSLNVRKEVSKIASSWGIGGIILGAIFGLWYLQKLPEESKQLLDSLPYLKSMLYIAAVSCALMIIYFLVLGVLKPNINNTVISIAMVIILFIGIGAGEAFREGIRRPYIIGNFMYGSSQIIVRDIKTKGIKSEIDLINEEGFLKKLYYLPDNFRKINENNLLEVGKVLVAHQCSGCHSIKKNGPIRPLGQLLEGMEQDEIKDILDGLDEYGYMPPFIGTEEEKEAASAYLATLSEEN